MRRRELNTIQARALEAMDCAPLRNGIANQLLVSFLSQRNAFQIGLASKMHLLPQSSKDCGSCPSNEQIASRLQERFGYAKEKAKKNFDDFVKPN